MEKKYCKSCGRQFRPHPQTPQQTFCSAPECQRERRRRAQQKRRNKDADYRENDSRNYQDWAFKNPDYWKLYRKANPAYAERNRQQQKTRNQRLRSVEIANVAASAHLSTLSSGRYMLTPYQPGVIAKEDVWIIEITVLSAPCDDFEG
jgi:hypothetical protein